MEKHLIREKNFSWLKHNAILVGVVWTMIMAGLPGWYLYEYKNKTHLLESIMATDFSHWWSIAYTHGVIWFFGLLGIGFIFFTFSKHLHQLEAQKLLLQQSQEHFKDFYQRAPVAFQSLDEDGTVLKVNETWLDTLGYQLDEVLGKDFAVFLTPESGKAFRRLFAQFKATGRTEGILLELRRYNGDIIKGKFYGRAERDEQGNFLRTICVFYDVTKNIGQQQTIAGLQRRNAAILSAAGEGIIGLDKKQRVMFVNPAAAEMLGAPAKELLGRDIHDIWHQGKVDNDFPGQKSCRICLDMEVPGKKVRLTETLWRRDGTSFPAELTISPILEGDEIAGALVVFVDVSEQLEKENRLSLLAAVVEQTESIVVIFDHQENITYLNPAFERITGHLVAEMQGKNVYEVFSPDPEHDHSRRELRSNLSQGKAWHGTLQSKKKDGTIFDEETVIFPIRDDQGRIIGYASIKHDISAQKKLEQQLAQVSKMESIGQLAGGVAHDFNNMLTVINGYAQIVLMRLEKGSRLWYDVREIEKAGERAAGLTRQLLAFSRKQVIMPKALQINDEIAEMEKMLRRLIGEDIELEFLLAENLPLIYADPSQLQQILLNLVVNARDALGENTSGSEKKIKISTSRTYLDDTYVARHTVSRQGWHVQLQVIDTGAGMSAEVSDHIFEPFFTTKGVGQGTGMGLATVYGIVRQNNGGVYVYSEPGQGTVFKIYWPIMAEKATKGEGKESAEPVVGGNETILLAEDDVGIRKIISRQLGQAGYTVIEAENGKDALEQAGNHQGVIDLLFTDVIMPIMGGKELSEKIKDIYPDIPVLFGSGYTDHNLPEEVIRSDKSQFVNKPYNIRDVMTRIRSLLDD